LRGRSLKVQSSAMMMRIFGFFAAARGRARKRKRKSERMILSIR
jgi:hypothetical protein